MITKTSTAAAMEIKVMLISRLLIFVSLFWASLGQSLAQEQNSAGEIKVGAQELSGSTDVQPMTMKELIDQTKKFEELLAKGLNEGADNQTTLEPVELDFNEDIFPTKKGKESQPESEPFKLVLKNSLRDARKSKECGRMTISYTLLPTSWTNHIQCSANDFTTKTKGWWDSGSLFTQNYDTSASGNVSSISFDLRYEIDGDSFTESVKLDPKSNEAHITVFGRGKATKYVFKIISMTSPEAKIPNKKSQWQVFAETRLSELEKPIEARATVTTTQKETDNRNKTTTLNKVDGDGRYSYYADGVCTDGLLNGRCISRSDFNNLCRKVGGRVYKDAHENPYGGAAFFGNKKQFARIWAARKFAGITGSRTQLRNNKCIFTFGYDGIVKGTRYSGRLACDLNKIIMYDGKPVAAGIDGFSCIHK